MDSPKNPIRTALESRSVENILKSGYNLNLFAVGYSPIKHVLNSK